MPKKYKPYKPHKPPNPNKPVKPPIPPEPEPEPPPPEPIPEPSMTKVWEHWNIANYWDEYGDLVIWNHTGKLWSEDDVYHFLAQGELNAGESFTISLPYIADHTLHIVGIKGTGEAPFELAISFQTSGHNLKAKSILNAPPVSDLPGTTFEEYLYYRGLPLPFTKPQMGYAVCATPQYLSGGRSEHTYPIEEGGGNLGILDEIKWSITNTSPERALFAFKGEFVRSFPEKVAEYSTIPVGFTFLFPGWEYEGSDPRFCWVPDYT